MTEEHRTPRSGWELKATFAFGVVFVMVILLLAITFPRPTEFQQTVFRIVLALAAAGVAALIPGFLAIRYKNIVRAGGALAFLVIVYFFNPAALIIDKAPFPTDQFRITIVFEQHNGKLLANSYDFPISDIRRKDSGDDFIALLRQLPNVPRNSLDKSTVFRTSDEAVIAKDGGTALQGANTGVLVIPNSTIAKYDNPHLAFTHIYSQVREGKNRNR